MDMSAVPSVDISAGDAIMDTIESLNSNGIKMVFSDVDPNVSKNFRRFGIIQKIGTESFYESPRDVMDAYLTSENAF